MVRTCEVNIDYYLGAYGKTIIIITQSRKWLLLLKESIIKVIDNAIDVLDICQLTPAKLGKSISKLELTKVRSSVSPCITAKNEEESTNFIWKKDEEELWTVVGLIDGLLRNDNPGHQYLADDDYIIELSYNEQLL